MIISKLEKYKKDLDILINNGGLLWLSLINKYATHLTEKEKELLKSPETIKIIPDFDKEYQSWYSEALELVRQVIPSRLDDFISYYKPVGKRKELDYESYTISDCLNHLEVTSGLKGKIVGPKAAIGRFYQQLQIIKSIKRKFESSLFDIKQLLQADVFDSELEAAKELNNKGFIRGAGAIAGVVLETHLSNVLRNNNIKITKKDPAINDLNNLLKENNVIDLPTWRFIQHLADLRNLCDHKKEREPVKADIEILISGTDKIIKTIY